MIIKFFLNIPNDDIPEITYFHNKKIGMTYKLIKNVISERMYSNFKILYLNVGLLRATVSLDELKDYFYYYSSMLFKYKDLNKFNNFSKRIFKILNNGFNLEEIINYILSYFSEETIKIVFDNIYSKDVFETLKNMKIVKGYNELRFYYVISLNEKTYEIFTNCIKNKMFYDKDKKYYFIQKENIDNLKLEDDFENIDDKETYKKNKIKEINEIIEKKGEYLIFSSLIVLINSINKDKISEEQSENVLNFLCPLIDYLLFQVTENFNIVKITFRNNVIKEIIYDTFIFSQSFHLLSEANISIDKILKKEEGNNFEKLIIYSLLINKYYSSLYKKVKVDSIYCITDIPIIKYDNQNILFFQENPFAQVYDFAILIIKNNELILKAYQIGINKSKNELLKLNRYIIELDLSYLIQKLETIINRKINKYTFGIITTKKALRENSSYPNFKTMKNFCKSQGYEFLLFDTVNCGLLIDKNDNNFTIIDNILDIKDSFNLKKINIIKEGNPIKIPIDKIKQEQVINNINEILIKKKLINQKLNLFLTGMFYGEPNKLYMKDYVCYYHKVSNNTHTIYLYYNNMEIIQQTKKEEFTKNNHILFFKIIQRNKNLFDENYKKYDIFSSKKTDNLNINNNNKEFKEFKEFGVKKAEKTRSYLKEFSFKSYKKGSEKEVTSNSKNEDMKKLNKRNEKNKKEIKFIERKRKILSKNKKIKKDKEIYNNNEIAGASDKLISDEEETYV